MTKTDILKGNLLVALEKSLGIVTTACKNVGCNRDTFYRYCKEDEDFKARVDELSNITLDFAESQLHKQIGEGNTTATIFFLKTKGKGRGYIERSDINIGSSERIKIDIMAFDEESTD